MASKLEVEELQQLPRMTMLLIPEGDRGVEGPILEASDLPLGLQPDTTLNINAEDLFEGYRLVQRLPISVVDDGLDGVVAFALNDVLYDEASNVRSAVSVMASALVGAQGRGLGGESSALFQYEQRVLNDSLIPLRPGIQASIA
jgi:hypothetical protein